MRRFLFPSQGGLAWEMVPGVGRVRNPAPCGAGAGGGDGLGIGQHRAAGVGSWSKGSASQRAAGPLLPSEARRLGFLSMHQKPVGKFTLGQSMGFL